MKKNVYAYLHTHWDTEWYRDKQDFDIRFLKVFDEVLDELKKNNAPYFYLDGQFLALENYLKYRKEKLDEILYFIKNKKLSIGPYYVSADSYLSNFCMAVKNLGLGIKYSKEFGQKEFIGYMADIFGISGSAFCALNLNNIDKAIVWRGVNPKKTNNNANFIKNNIKTTWLVQGYFNDFFHSNPINIDGINDYLNKISKYSNPILFPIGADHLGILKNAKEKINFVNRNLKNYKIILTSPFEYFKHTDFKDNTNEKEFLDNSNTYILPGVYSARIYQKRNNSFAQHKLTRLIEPLDFYLGKKYSPNIEYCYKTLMKNHAHDGIYGCSTDKVHRAIDYRIEKCQNALDSILSNIIYDFKTKNNIQGESAERIGLFNLSNNDDIKVVEIKLPYVLKNSQIIEKQRGFKDSLLFNLRKIPVTEDICPIYTQIIEIEKNKKFEYSNPKIIPPKKTHKITHVSIENKYIGLNIKNNKIFISNKKTDEKYELKISDIKDQGDSYNFCPKGEYTYFNLLKSEILYKGQIESCLRLRFKNITLDIRINNHNEFLDFKAQINNKKKNRKIQLVLIHNNNIKETTAQDMAGYIKRKIDYNYNIKDHMPAVRPKELKTNTFPMQNFVCTKDLIVLTKGLNEYEVYKNELRICMLRAFGTISNPKNKTRAIPAGPDIKTPQAQVLGENYADFAICFGDFKKAFYNLDIFFKNYVVFDGNFTKNNKIKLDEIPKEKYIYGLYQNKKISFNFKDKKISLI